MHRRNVFDPAGLEKLSGNRLRIHLRRPLCKTPVLALLGTSGRHPWIPKGPPWAAPWLAWISLVLLDVGPQQQ